jgi:hypothetical protein
LDLVNELERQRLGKKVIADMFGLALRSYQQKVQRLAESVTSPGVTLWAAVNEFVADKGVVDRADVLDRFRNDHEASLRGILNDLVASGLLYRTGRGDATVYRYATPKDLDAFEPFDAVEARANLAWVEIYRHGPTTEQSLARQLRLDASNVAVALEQLERDGRVQREERNGERFYRADRCLIPLGSKAGWEAAVVDHHRALVSALIAKLRVGRRSASAKDEIGGSTFAFDLWPGHPFESETRGLLAQIRGQLVSHWDRVAEHNEKTTRPEDGVYKVTFYCGQSLDIEPMEEEP